MNDDNEFSKSFQCIYPRELELNLVHSGTRATFLNLDIKIDEIFAYKLFDKIYQIQFFIGRMPHFQINIPSTIIYGSIFSEFFCIARCTLKLELFVCRPSELYSRMLFQGQIKLASLSRFKKNFKDIQTH